VEERRRRARELLCRFAYPGAKLGLACVGGFELLDGNRLRACSDGRFIASARLAARPYETTYLVSKSSFAPLLQFEGDAQVQVGFESISVNTNRRNNPLNSDISYASTLHS